MAEIPIQRKERRNFWPMLVGLIAVAAVLWFAFTRRDTANVTAARADSAAVTRDSAGGVTTDSARATKPAP